MMRWLRPAPEPVDDAAAEEVARTLEATAAEAPPSPRVEEIRHALLEGLGDDRRPMPILAPLAVIAVVLLAVVVAVGAPLVGSYLDRLTEDRGPSPTLPDEDETTRVPPRPAPEEALEVPRVTDASTPPSAPPPGEPAALAPAVPDVPATPPSPGVVAPSPSAPPEATPTPPPAGPIQQPPVLPPTWPPVTPPIVPGP